MNRRWLPALLLAVAMAAPGHAAGKCDSVKASGRFATITMPANLTTASLEVVPATSRSQRDVIVAAVGRVIMRTTDGGCTWQQVYSLDTDPPDTWWAKRTASMVLSDIAVSQNPTGQRTLYVVGRDTTAGFTVALPIVTLVSTDNGAHWQLREPPLSVEGLDQRCAYLYVTAGPDPRLAHLTCSTAGLGEVALTVAVQCPSMQFVTTDAAATWRPVHARYSTPDAGLARSCAQFAMPFADAATKHVLWEMPGCGRDLKRSADDGKTVSVYASLPTNGCYLAGASGLDRAGRSLIVACGNGSVFVAKPGKFTRSPGVPLRAHQLGTIRGCAIDRATDRVVTFYLDGEFRPRVFLYDIARGTWHHLGIVPVDKKATMKLWDEYGTVEGWVAPTSRYVYARKAWFADRLVRITL